MAYTLNVIRTRGATQKSKAAAKIRRLSFPVAAPSMHPPCSVVPIDFVPRIVKSYGFFCGESEKEIL